MTSLTAAMLAPPMMSVPVDGGELAVGIWANDAEHVPSVLAIHGITANHRCWALVAEQLPEVRLIAPDLRGRGLSNTLGPPYGLDQHVRDLIAVLDHLGEKSVAVVAHSMGAFVAVLLAARHPERVASLTLVDGGLPLEWPRGVTRDQPTGEISRSPDATALLGPAAQRLSMQFSSREAYRQFWREHPAFENHSNAVVEGYIDYDLQGTAPTLRPSGVLAAVSADVVELYGGDSYVDALASIRVPTTFLRAPRGLLNEPAALYSSDRAHREPRVAGMMVVEVDDVNHYTILFERAGATVVAREVSAALGEPDGVRGEPQGRAGVQGRAGAQGTAGAEETASVQEGSMS
jgi:lipase